MKYYAIFDKEKFKFVSFRDEKHARTNGDAVRQIKEGLELIREGKEMGHKRSDRSLSDYNRYEIIELELK